MNLGDKLKELRKEKGKTQQQMSEDLSISIQSINKWENGKCLPDAVNLLNLAIYFNVSLDDLLSHKVKHSYKIKNVVRRNIKLFIGRLL